MRALSVIEAEHGNMRRLSSALDGLADGLAKEPPGVEIHTLELIIQYFEEFTDRFHHPKEDDFLFAKLRQRSSDAVGVVERLHREHELGTQHLHRIKALMQKPMRTPVESRALVDEVHSFCRQLDAHMRLEEEGTFALARRAFDSADWAEVDAAFDAHVDPLGDAAGEASLPELRRRITQLLPAPYGLGGNEDIARQASTPTVAAQATPMLAVTDLHSRYGRIEALHGVSLAVTPGEIVVLVGANGAGKTTLLRCISGVQPTSGGDVTFAERTITRMQPEARVRAGICQVPEGRQVFSPMSTEDNLRMGAHTRPVSEIEASLAEMYALFPILKEKRSLPAGTLSGGQQQMLALGRALMGKPKLLLLDEPSMGLAPLIVEEIFRIVRQLRDRGITILLVEQNARAALAIADRGYVMETGRIVLSGGGRELLSNAQVQKAYLGM